MTPEQEQRIFKKMNRIDRRIQVIGVLVISGLVIGVAAGLIHLWNVYEGDWTNRLGVAVIAFAFVAWLTSMSKDFDKE